MPHWLIKAALQRGISVLPSSQKWNELFQKHITKSIELTPARFEERLRFCNRHFENLLELRSQPAGAFNAVEVGTGWYLTVPMGLFLCGAAGIWTYDISPLVNTERLHRLLTRFADYWRAGKLQQFLPHVLRERAAQLADLAQEALRTPPDALLKKINIHLRVQDAQQTGLQPNTVDLIVSTGVLEYIPRPVLTGMLAEFRRVATPGAVTSHYLNLVDQYSYFDSSITPFNFLKFSPGQWAFYNSPLIWQNRLRISDFRDLLTQANFELVKEESTSGSVQDLKSIRLAPEFQNYNEADLLVLISWIAARLRN